MTNNNLQDQLFLIFHEKISGCKESIYTKQNCIFVCDSQDGAIDMIIKELKLMFFKCTGFNKMFGRWFLENWFKKYEWEIDDDWRNIEKLPQKVPPKRNFLHYF
jgi:hypothetical protein